MPFQPSWLALAHPLVDAPNNPAHPFCWPVTSANCLRFNGPLVSACNTARWRCVSVLLSVALALD